MEHSDNYAKPEDKEKYLREYELFVNKQMREGFMNEDEFDDAYFEYFMQLIKDANVEKVIEAILSMEKFIKESNFYNQWKLDWWDNALRGKIITNDEGKIQFPGIHNELVIVDTIQDVYLKYIKIKNETIWVYYDKAINKALVEMIVDKIVKTCKKIPLITKYNFIKSTISAIRLREINDRYFKQELDEHLSYYKHILELSLDDSHSNNDLEIREETFGIVSSENRISTLLNSLLSYDYDAFFIILKSIYASVPYQIFTERESYFHVIFHVILSMVLKSTTSEDTSNLGRADTVLIISGHVFIFECKLYNAQIAVAQIHEKKYYMKYLDSYDKIILIGIAFSFSEKNIVDYKIENFK